MKTWIKEEMELLANNADKPKRELERLFPDRSWISVKRRKERLKKGIPYSNVQKQTWSEEEEELMAKNIDEPKEKLEELFPSRSWHSIKGKKKGIKIETKSVGKLEKRETNSEIKVYERFMDYHRTYWSSS